MRTRANRRLADGRGVSMWDMVPDELLEILVRSTPACVLPVLALLKKRVNRFAKDRLVAM